MEKDKCRWIIVWLIITAFFIGCTPMQVLGSEKESMENYRREADEYDHYENGGIQVFSTGLADKINNIVVFLRFSDTDEYANNTTVGYADKTYNSGQNSLKNYLKRISYGQIDIHTYFYPQDDMGNYYSIQVSHEADYYKKQYMKSTGVLSAGYTDEAERMKREKELITEAVSGIRAQLEVCDKDLDLNNDGYIDGISFVAPVLAMGIDHIDKGDLLWPHKTDVYINVPINGKFVYTYNLVNKGSANYGILGQYGQLSGTVIHEFLHTLSLPDLYRYGGNNTNPLGGWDIMDSGMTANITAWYQREYLGFGAHLPVYTESTKNITLSTAQYVNANEVYAVILKSKRNTDEYFVVENRKIESGNEEKQKNSGLLVYRVMNNPAGPYAANGNVQGPPDFIFAYRPNETSANAADGDIAYATLSPDNEKGFTSLGKALGTEAEGYDNRTIYYSDGTNSGIVIDNIKKNDDGTMTFDVSFPEMMKGEGTEDKPYEIYTLHDLNTLSAAPAKTYYKLMNDIDLSGGFNMISNFKGILDGNNKTIKGLNISGAYTAAFIDVLETGAEVRNLIFEAPTLYTSDASGYSSVFASVNGTVKNVAVNGGTITSLGRAGGLAGILNGPDGLIENCLTSANVNGDNAGGLLSYMNGGKIKDSYIFGKVSGIKDSSVTGSVFAFWLKYNPGTAENIYWDINKSGQISNGLVWLDNTPANVSGCYGLEIRCPDSVNEGADIEASVFVANGAMGKIGRWIVSDTSILKTDASTGIITGKSGGTASIYYEFNVGTHTVRLDKTIDCIAAITPETNPPETNPPETNPPETNPPETNPPETNPPETNPPETEPQYNDKVEAFVARLYINILNRSPDGSGLAAWTGVLKSGREQGAKVAQGFLQSPEFRGRTLSNEEYIKILYRTFLGREADVSGLEGWLSVLNSGLSRMHVFRGFAESDEFTGICSESGIIRGYVQLTMPEDQNEGITKFVVRCYRLCLGREADGDGLNAWCSQILTKKNTAKQVAYGFVFSNEFKSKKLGDADYVKILYKVFLDRDADTSGLQGWTTVLSQGKSREHVFNGFADSPEFRGLCQKYGIN